jgi:hypothetical protein
MDETEKRKIALELAVKMAGCQHYVALNEKATRERRFSKMVIEDAEFVYEYLFSDREGKP